MNVQALQKADRAAGVPLCWILSCFRSVFGRWRTPSTRPPRSLLIVKLAEQGSTVLAYAALRRAVELVGREHVYFVALAPNRFILDVLEVIPPKNVITVPVKSVPAFLFGMLGAIRKLRQLRFDAAVDLEFFSRGSAALTYLSGAKCRVGFHSFSGEGPYRGDLMTHRLIYNPHLHTSETFRTMVDALTCDPRQLPTMRLAPEGAIDVLPSFKPSAEETAVVEQLAFGDRVERPLLILLNPNASDLVPLRRWPRERYIELARRVLARHPDALIGLTGAPEEANGAAEIARQIGSDRCVSLAGKTTLRQLLVLYTLAEVLVTNDSGPAHFATLTPIHVVTLFGPETPRLFAARTPRNTVLWAGLACSPCVSAYNNRVSPCRDNQCMQSITVDEVFAAVNDALSQRLRERRRGVVSV